jgi:D-alanine-D-alanine ligase
MKGGGLKGTVISSRSGAAVYNCSMSLKEKGHAEDVSRAVNILSRIVNNWTGMTDETKGLVVVPTEMNLRSNIMGHYANAEMLLSIRYSDTEQMQQIDKKIRSSLTARERKILRFQIDGGIRRPPMNRDEAVAGLFETVKRIGQTLDIRIVEDHRWSSADICFAPAGTPMIDGMGPIGTKIKGSDEYILRHSLLERSALLALTLLEIGLEKN